MAPPPWFGEMGCRTRGSGAARPIPKDISSRRRVCARCSMVGAADPMPEHRAFPEESAVGEAVDAAVALGEDGGEGRASVRVDPDGLERERAIARFAIG